MTNEQINAAIAIQCGWMQVEAIHRSGRRPGATYVGREFIPDYCSDLNAMHEAERVCLFGNEKAEETYWLNLYDVCGTTRWPFDATARHRAEAFLRTLGKWEEVQP